MRGVAVQTALLRGDEEERYWRDIATAQYVPRGKGHAAKAGRGRGGGRSLGVSGGAADPGPRAGLALPPPQLG